MSYAFLVEPGKKVDLKDFDPDYHAKLEKNEGKEELRALAEEIGELQELMFAARQSALLIVFQGRDTAGKDGAINEVISYVNVQSCRTVNFKVPTPEEAAHDFLWRVHPYAPGLGGVTLFNRSHYEDVLAARVHEIVPPETWKKRFDQINQFEALLASANTVILKFYLHISKDEQEERLLAREKDTTKAWKLAVGDWKERLLWDDYTKAYEDALGKCSTEAAPWRIVPANHKWFRDLAVAEAIRDELLPLKKQWLDHLEKVGAEAKKELAEYRNTQQAPRP